MVEKAAQAQADLRGRHRAAHCLCPGRGPGDFRAPSFGTPDLAQGDLAFLLKAPELAQD